MPPGRYEGFVKVLLICLILLDKPNVIGYTLINKAKGAEMKITITQEVIKVNGTDYINFALTGNTFQAKEIIKGLGYYHWSKEIGLEPAWRTDIMSVENAKKDGTFFTKVAKETAEALQNAGFKIATAMVDLRHLVYTSHQLG